MKRFAAQAVTVMILLCVLLACSPRTEQPDNITESSTVPQTTAETAPPSGWQETDGNRYYLHPDGTYAVGWLELDSKRYYLDENGILQTGWLETDGNRYYLLEDGSMARGRVEIEGTAHYFTSAGTPILLVNPWNYIPEDYAPDLVTVSTSIGYAGCQVERSCYDALTTMMADCKKESGSSVYIISGYRSHQTQATNYNRMVNEYIYAGYSRDEARKKAATEVAIPGTSEHQSGLAVDIIDTRQWTLTENQANLPGQKWLMENCWRYGFILRYPADKTAVTGIIYEPWHYRYVGTETAAEIHRSGLTLEEYLDDLTEK